MQRYLGAFVAVAQVKLNAIPNDPLSVDRSGWEVPLPLAIGLGARIGQGEPFSADWLLAWFLCHPESSLRTPAKRAPDEFAATFRALFEKRFPDGLKVTKPRKKLSATYEAASGEFRADLVPEVDGSPVLDVSGLRKPIEIAQEVADEAMEALDGYSRLLGRDEAAGGTLRGHLMLPAAIRAQFPCPARDELEEWARARIAADGLVPVCDVIERVMGYRTEKPSKRDLTETSDMLARIGIGMAPDPRFALRRPKPEEPVVLFDLGREVEVLENVSQSYSEATLRIALGAFVAHADGRIVEAEREGLIAQVRATQLPTEEEQRRLMANLWWFLSVPPDMSVLRKRLKETSAEQAGALRAALVAAVHSDGEVSADEVSSLEKAYRALGLDAKLVYSDLHAGDANAPVTVRAARPATAGEAIPDEPAAAGAAKLDLDRIAAIQSDTARVSEVLGSIFTDVADQEAQPAFSDPDAPSPAETLPGLDAAHTRVVNELLAQAHWNEDAFDTLCHAQGLMPAGALETINEWSFEHHEEALIDTYEGYEIEPELAAILRGELEEVPCPS